MRRGLIPIALVALLAVAVAADDKAGEAARLAQAWSAVPLQELEGLWERAQATGGVIAVEPESQVVGSPAASKKTWMVADRLLKFFVFGDQPNWFPVDAVRRTACGSNPRWSYFWHLASGDERDLHPWVDGSTGYKHLVGPKKDVLLGGRALDLSACKEVNKDARDDQACLYGEVTPTKGFDTWFCGNAGQECRSRVSARPRRAPPDLADAEVACMHGPWVLERVHNWRPEIHPAEVLWVRKKHEQGYWTFALVPDDSKRFRKKGHFEGGPKPADWKPWSSNRPVELWVAFSEPRAQRTTFDLSVKPFDKEARPAVQVTLTPPDPAPAFSVLPHRLSSTVMAAARTWPNGPDAIRGFLVLRATTANKERRTLVMRLRGREANAPEWPAELLPAVGREEAGLVSPAEVRPPAVRLLGFTRVRPGSGGAATVSILVRFDPVRPSEPGDEEAAYRLNKALRGNASKRRGSFGTDRPFRVEFDVQPDSVRAVTFRGPATSAVIVRTRQERTELSDRERVTYLGSIDITVPAGVAARGEGQITYTGQDIGLQRSDTNVIFRLPQPTFVKDREWDLVSDVLTELDETTATVRLDALRRDACEPGDPRECDTALLAPSVVQALADPSRRWATMRTLTSGNRPFARFVRLFAKALVWDGEVEDQERERLKSLLKADTGGES